MSIQTHITHRTRNYDKFDTTNNKQSSAILEILSLYVVKQSHCNLVSTIGAKLASISTRQKHQRLTRKTSWNLLSYDVMAAILVYQNNPVRVELFFLSQNFLFPAN